MSTLPDMDKISTCIYKVIPKDILLRKSVKNQDLMLNSHTQNLSVYNTKPTDNGADSFSQTAVNALIFTLRVFVQHHPNWRIMCKQAAESMRVNLSAHLEKRCKCCLYNDFHLELVPQPNFSGLCSEQQEDRGVRIVHVRKRAVQTLGTYF